MKFTSTTKRQREAARATRRHGLKVDDAGDGLLDITPIDWRKRLPR